MFERNHNLIPEIDPEDYELLLMADGKKDENPLVLTLDDIKRLGNHELDVCIACAGSKRRPLQEEFPTIKGLKWTNGAAANAVYKGVLVRDILLKKMGLKEEDLIGKGLQLVTISYDSDFQGTEYEVSVPIEHALDPSKQIMIAYEMNGA